MEQMKRTSTANGRGNKSVDELIAEYKKSYQPGGDCLYNNYKRIKTYISKKQRNSNARTEMLNRFFTNARKDKRENFNKNEVNIFADWGYTFESFEFGDNKDLELYAKKQRVVHFLTRFILVPIMACFVVGIFVGPIVGPLIRELSSNMSKGGTSPDDDRKNNCTAKLVKYAWDDEDGCQKASFSSKSDCLWSTYGKTYFYDENTHSYKKYYEYDYDKDLYEYDGSGVHKHAVGDTPDGKLEFYITCSDDGNWYTNEIKGNASGAIRYWIDNTQTTINGK